LLAAAASALGCARHADAGAAVAGDGGGGAGGAGDGGTYDAPLTATETGADRGHAPQVSDARQDGPTGDSQPPRWARLTSSTLGAGANGIAALADGTIVVVGSYTGMVTFGPGEPVQATLSSQASTSPTANSEPFVASYGEDGAVRWARRIPGATALTIAATAAGDGFILAGTFASGATLAIGESNQTVLDTSGGIFLAQYRADGTLIWARPVIAAPSIAVASAAAAVGADGAIFVGAAFTGTAMLGIGGANTTSLTSPSGETDGFVAQFTPDATLAWVTTLVGHGDQTGVDQLSIATAGADQVAIAGDCFGPLTVGSGQQKPHALAPYSMANDADLFLARLRSSDGNVIDALRFGSEGTDSRALVAGGRDGSVYLAGQFGRTATFTDATGNPITLHSDAYTGETFLARFSPAGSLAWVDQLRAGNLLAPSALAVDAAGEAYLGGYGGTPVSLGTNAAGDQVGWSDPYDACFLSGFDARGTVGSFMRATGTSTCILTGIAFMAGDGAPAFAGSFIVGSFYLPNSLGGSVPHETYYGEMFVGVSAPLAP